MIKCSLFDPEFKSRYNDVSKKLSPFIQLNHAANACFVSLIHVKTCQYCLFKIMKQSYWIYLLINSVNRRCCLDCMYLDWSLFKYLDLLIIFYHHLMCLRQLKGRILSCVFRCLFVFLINRLNRMEWNENKQRKFGRWYLNLRYVTIDFILIELGEWPPTDRFMWSYIHKNKYSMRLFFSWKIVILVVLLQLICWHDNHRINESCRRGFQMQPDI